MNKGEKANARGPLYHARRIQMYIAMEQYGFCSQMSHIANTERGVERQQMERHQIPALSKGAS